MAAGDRGAPATVLSIVDERRHVAVGPRPGERPSGVGTVPLVLTCDGDADEVLVRLRDAFDRILAAQADRWPSGDKWRALLPAWLVDAFAPEGTGEDATSATPATGMTGSGDDDWNLDGWTFWFEPDIRPWFWWHGAIAGHDTIEMSFEVEGHPTPYGALRFLFQAAGATDALIDGA